MQKKNKNDIRKKDCSNKYRLWYFSFHLWKLSVKSAETLNWRWHSVNIGEQPVSRRDTPSCMPAVVCHPATSFEVLQPSRLHEEWAKTDWGCKKAYHVSPPTIKINPSLIQYRITCLTRISPWRTVRIIRQGTHRLHLVSVRDWHVQRK